MMRVAHILLVDDEAPLLDLLGRYLERLGHQVDASRYDLVLTDLALPGMTGDQMLAQMRKRSPNLRAIISSGYPYEPTGKWIRFLQKPFLPKMLAELIDESLKAYDATRGA
jgi:DNA-binding NtrC family response regulator